MVYSDHPIDAASLDTLDRARVATALCELLHAPSTETPLVVGIFGDWGTGKTSLMRLLESQLLVKSEAEDDGLLTLWFDAWKYARQEQSLWRALLLKVIEDLGARAAALVADDATQADVQGKLRELRESLYQSLTVSEHTGFRINWGSAFPLAADLALRYATAGLSDMAGDKGSGDGPFARFLGLLKGEDAREAMKFIEQEERDRYVAQVTSLEQFRQTFEAALRLLGITEGPADGGPKRRLFLFVDDLDRCLPDDAVAAIEAIKLFLDLPGCVFVLGMDRKVVEPGIRARYRAFIEQDETAFKPEDYLDKVIQIPFTLPPLGPGQLESYLNDLAAAAKDPDQIVNDTRDLVQVAAPENPRSLKRVLNVLRLMVALDGDRWEERRTQRRYLAKMVLLQVCFPEAYRRVAGGELELVGFETVATRPAEGNQLTERLLATPRLKDLMTAEPLFKDLKNRPAELNRLLTLSEMVSTTTTPSSPS